MSTDLRTALRDAVADEPTFLVDPRAIAHAGRHRVRRRTAMGVGAVAVATAAVLVTTAVVSRPSTPRPDPAPAERTVRLDLDDAVAVHPDVVATTRTTWRDEGKSYLEYDRFDGITADGLILRSRDDNATGDTALGLLDPATGSTDWLPEAPADLYGMQPLALDVDRLVLGIAAGNGHSVMVFDRLARTWGRRVVRVPDGLEVHVQQRMALGPGERVYVGSTMEDGPTPTFWWSAPIATGGTAASEPELEGAGVAWSGQAELVAHADGRVVLTTPAGVSEVADARPRDCTVIEEWPDIAPQALLAGRRAVVTWFCQSGPVTVVYENGEDEVHVVDAVARASDGRHLLLTGATGPAAALGSTNSESTGTYVLDLDRRELHRIGDGPWERQVALDAGLVLWNSAGPLEDHSTYDVVWTVATLE